MIHIYYWQQYKKNLRELGAITRLNQNSEGMRDINVGDTVVTITLSKEKSKTFHKTKGEYAIVAKFIVCEVGENSKSSEWRKYGKYFFYAKPSDTCFFDIKRQDDYEPIGRKIHDVREKYYGQGHQGSKGVYEINNKSDEKDLTDYIASLPLDMDLEKKK